jgi:rare lipoprotein A
VRLAKNRLALAIPLLMPVILLGDADAQSGSAGAQSGIASVYGYGAHKTASGERADPAGMTAAHKTLPFGMWVQVTNKHNGNSVLVRINDRGPFVRGRVIDVTPAAARALGFATLTPVSLEVAR